MKAVADYVHSKGLKLGIYTDRGDKTCDGRPASLNTETLDAQTFADWGIDYLKEDSCNAPDNIEVATQQYGRMRDALKATGRPIYFSLCGWHSWYAPIGKDLGNSWRIGGDVNTYGDMFRAIRINERLAAFAGPGAWNDPDMLVGSSETASVYLTPAQSRTQFSLWSVMAAPLLIGSNMLNMTAFDLETYTNQEVIAVDQDKLGKQGMVLKSSCPPELPNDDDNDTPLPCHQVWGRPLANGNWAVVLVNYDTGKGATVTCDADCMSIMGLGNGANVRDLWAHKDLGRMGTVSATLPAGGASVMYVLSKL